MSAAAKPAAPPDAVALTEEAVHLLREAPAATLVIYYAGAVPFVLGLLFFWAATTWFAPSPAAVAWAALGLAVLFALMKGCQAEFCLRLLAQRLGTQPARWTPRRFMGLTSEQMRLQAWGLFLLPVAFVMVVPFGWVYAYFQGVSVAGSDDRTHQRALAQATDWPAQNHLGLLFFSLLGLCALVNLGATFWLLPWLANRLLGVENLFGFSGWWFANTTFWASVAALAWLAIDPLVKAFYTLRVFHGRSRATGEDLRVMLHGARRDRAGLRIALGLAWLVAATTAGPRLWAAESPAVTSPARSLDPAQLDRAIDEVLAGRDFQWRMRPAPPAEDASEDGPIKRFVRTGVQMMAECLRWIGNLARDVVDWIAGFFPKGSKASPGDSASMGLGALRVALYVLLAGALLLIVAIIVLVYRRSRSSLTRVLSARVVAPAAPDLHDEATQAAQLPAEGWLALAREKLARHEWRLALRALQLAALARLAEEGLVSLAKFKTNLDYERELRRRALARHEIVARFAARRGLFEAVWYGRAEAAETDVRDWLAELERPMSP